MLYELSVLLRIKVQLSVTVRAYLMRSFHNRKNLVIILRL